MNLTFSDMKTTVDPLSGRNGASRGIGDDGAALDKAVPAFGDLVAQGKGAPSSMDDQRDDRNKQDDLLPDGAEVKGAHHEALQRTDPRAAAEWSPVETAGSADRDGEAVGAIQEIAPDENLGDGAQSPGSRVARQDAVGADILMKPAEGARSDASAGLPVQQPVTDQSRGTSETPIEPALVINESLSTDAALRAAREGAAGVGRETTAQKDHADLPQPNRAAHDTSAASEDSDISAEPVERKGADRIDVPYTTAPSSTSPKAETVQYGLGSASTDDSVATGPAATSVQTGATAFAPSLAGAVPLPINTVFNPAKPAGERGLAAELDAGLVARGVEQGQNAETRPLSSVPRPMTTEGTDALHEIVRAAVAAKGPTTIELRLDRAELGQLDIELSFADDRVSIAVRAEREEAMDLMRRSSDELTKLLRQAGLDLDSLTFSHGQSDGREQDDQFQALTTEKMAGGDDITAQPAMRPGVASARLDIRI